MTLSTVPATTPTVNQPEIVPVNGKYEIHLYTMTGDPCAKLVQHTPKGRHKTKTIDNIRFKSDERRQQWAIWKAAAILKEDRERAERAAERKQTNASAQATVGMIFVHSWGYDQTNIDFYEVTAVSESGRQVTLRELQQDRTHDGNLSMQGTCTPKPSAMRTMPIIRRNPSASMTMVGFAWMKAESGLTASIITATATSTAITITGTSSVMPTAVMMESTENTRSSIRICTIAEWRTMS